MPPLDTLTRLLLADQPALPLPEAMNWAERRACNLAIDEQVNEHLRKKGHPMPQMPAFPIHAEDHKSTNCLTITLGTVSLHFSYRTLVGVHLWGENGGAFRRDNEWGKTTAKHMNLMGLGGNVPVRSEQELFEIVRGALFTDVVHRPLAQGDDNG